MPNTPEEITALLRRILDAVQPTRRRGGFEFLCAVVLSLATTASAWCAYEAKRWGGAQLARAGIAVGANHQAAVHSLAAMQARAFDAAMFIEYIEAKFETNQAVETFLSRRFRPEMKAAVEAWLATDPLINPAAPPSPLHMAEYAPKESAEAARQEQIAAKAMAGAREARQISDNYVLLTVLFASVLFFGGIARVFESGALRVALAMLAILLFLATLAALGTMPLCRE